MTYSINDTQHSTLYKVPLCWISFMLSVTNKLFMLSVIMQNVVVPVKRCYKWLSNNWTECVKALCVIIKTEQRIHFWRKPRKLQMHHIPRKIRIFCYSTKLRLDCMCEWGLKCLIIDIIATLKIRFNNCFVWKTQFFKIRNLPYQGSRSI